MSPSNMGSRITRYKSSTAYNQTKNQQPTHHQQQSAKDLKDTRDYIKKELKNLHKQLETRLEKLEANDPKKEQLCKKWQSLLAIWTDNAERHLTRYDQNYNENGALLTIWVKLNNFRDQFKFNLKSDALSEFSSQRITASIQ